VATSTPRAAAIDKGTASPPMRLALTTDGCAPAPRADRSQRIQANEPVTKSFGPRFSPIRRANGWSGIRAASNDAAGRLFTSTEVAAATAAVPHTSRCDSSVEGPSHTRPKVPSVTGRRSASGSCAGDRSGWRRRPSSTRRSSTPDQPQNDATKRRPSPSKQHRRTPSRERSRSTSSLGVGAARATPRTGEKGATASDLQSKSVRTSPIAPATSNTRSRTPRRSVVGSSRTLSEFSRHPRT
jgi:hypothetical protein